MAEGLVAEIKPRIFAVSSEGQDSADGADHADGCVPLADSQLLSSKVSRWYADCCRTPIANTATDPRFPVVALIHSIIDCAADGRSRDARLGPPLCRIYERSAIGPLPSNAAPPPSLRVFSYRATKIVGWWMRGLARPNPFFDDRTKAPRSVPHLLSPTVNWR